MTHLDRVVLGRSHASTIALDKERDTLVSGLHAAISRHEGHWWIEDLGSKNGTWLNGHRIAQGIRLCPGDEIVLGRPRLAGSVRMCVEFQQCHGTTNRQAQPRAAERRARDGRGRTSSGCLRPLRRWLAHALERLL